MSIYNADADSSSRRQLIVVGNGFDLECGLKSRFFDFFSRRFETLKRIDSDDSNLWRRVRETSDLTAWDFILFGSRYGKWCDIEGAIADWVVSPVSTTGLISWHIRKVLEILNSSINLFTIWCGPYHPQEEMVKENDMSSVYSNVARLVKLTIDKLGRSLSERDILAFLRNELTSLEDTFGDYMRGQQDSAYSDLRYGSSCAELCRAMMVDGGLDFEAAKKQTTVLSFNYTNPFSDPRVSIGIPEGNVVNIHGDLKGRIIFGIDGKDCMDDAGALPFTKTYRVIMQGVPVGQGLITRTGDNTLDAIKFYGHSLAKADYSYFQSIFDSIGLYGGRTKLVFYYRAWRQGNGQRVDEETARTDMVQKVSMLLTEYGSTLENKDHGKNLMHKLLLEGRLEVKQI